MLDLKKNRLDYGELLMPPPKFELTHAVGTTYSLDLFTLLAIPVALFYSKVLDGSFEENRFDIIESIQKTAGILNIYCQKGKIKVPRKFNWLFAYIEDSIHEITPANAFSSFHPKVWILRFKKSQEVRYRIIVLSRNLTFDRSWDLAFHVEGALENNSFPSNKPLLDFLNHLLQTKKVTGSNTLLNELPNIKFEGIDGFKNFLFHPIGIDNYQRYPNPLDKRAFDKLLVVTPFVDATTLKKLHQNCPNQKVLISREEELQKIPPKLFQGYEPYFLSRLIVDGETAEGLDETDFEPQRQELHAKLFVGAHQRRYYWFMGSANCTDPAFTRNTEFMVELEGENNRVGPDYMKKILINPEDDAPVFEPYEPVALSENEGFESIRRLVRRLEYDLINISFIGKLLSREKSPYFNLLLMVDLEDIQWDENIDIKTAPLNLAQNTQLLYPKRKNEFVFENLSEIELSQFAMLTIEYKKEKVTSFLVKMQIDLPDTRKDKILKGLVASRENFFKYLDFLLSENPYLETPTLGDPGDKAGASKDEGHYQFSDLPIFEHLLLTASRNPKKLKSIDRLIQRLEDEDPESGENIIPEDFYEFWKIFKQAAGIK